MDECRTAWSALSGARARASRRSLKLIAVAWAACACACFGTIAQAQATPESAPVDAEASAPPPAEPAPSVVIAQKVVPPPAPVVVVASTPPPPPPLKPVENGPSWSPVFTGSFFTRYELRENYDNVGVNRARFQDGDAVFYRTRLGIGTGPIDVGKDFKVALQFTPQASGVLGSLPNTITDASLGLHEGYLRVSRHYVRFDAGRFELNYGDAFIIGNLDWHQTARSFDGFRARIAASPSSAWLDLFATIIHEGHQQAIPFYKAGDGDQLFFGAYAGLGPAISEGLDLDVYLLGQTWTESARAASMSPPAGNYKRDGATQITIGARAKQKIKRFDYRFEGGVQAGKRSVDALVAAMPANVAATDVLAYQGDLELGVAAVPDRLRIALEGLYASGNDPSTGKNEGWDELYPTAHKWLGLTDAFVLGGQKRTNVMSGVLHVTAKPMAALTFQVDGHVFARPEKVAVASASGMPAQKDGYAGAEVDIGAVYQLAEKLKARALYGVFVPSSDLYPTPTALAFARGQDPDPIHYLEIELRYDL